MKKINLIAPVIGAFIVSPASRAAEISTTDTLTTLNMNEIVVISSQKETNSLQMLPSSVSIIAPHQIANRQISSIKDISVFVPNLYIPDYGAKLTSAVYLRGVGARSSGQSIGLYVDGAPVPDKSAFDFELADVSLIEVLRGPQGTLYGRNAMGGIISIQTLSPLRKQGVKASAAYGNYGRAEGKFSAAFKLHPTLGVSINAYHSQHDGFFTNAYNGKKADSEQTSGGNVKIAWQAAPRFTATLSASYDNVRQGAFPYGHYNEDTGTVEQVFINDTSTYRRETQTDRLTLEYAGDNLLFTSVTGYQYLNDDMRMDQDFSAASMFVLKQRQRQHAFSEELTLKNKSTGNYRWLTGLFGFYDRLYTDGPVEFKQDGMSTIFQPMFDDLKKNNPRMPEIKVDSSLHVPGAFQTPAFGLAAYHQSTVDNMFIDGLSLTAGIRFDYERQQLKYASEAKMRLFVKMSPAAPPIDAGNMYEPSVIDENLSQDFTQILPKISLKYAFSERNFIYMSAAKGYKAGGYNVQMSADIMQNQMRYDVMNAFKAMLPNADSMLNALKPQQVKDVISYKPETSWNYEIGFKCEPVKDRLYAEAALFYMDINNLQLTKFVEGGNGRILSNAGRANSYGTELSLRAQLTDNLSADVNYGFTHATFSDYNNDRENFAGKSIPYTPQHTLSAGLNISQPLRVSWADRFTASAQCNAAGEIYWTESNTLSQPFHAAFNAQASLHQGAFSLGLWARNLTNAGYSVFYFESFGKSYMQRAKPLQFGVKVAIAL